MPSNGFDPECIAGFVTRIETLRGELKEAAAAVGQQIRGIIKEAEATAGVPPKALQMLLRRRTLESQVAALPVNDHVAFDHLTAALAALSEPPERVPDKAAPTIRPNGAPQAVRAA